MVERNLAKVEVESSRLFSRSKFLRGKRSFPPFHIRRPFAARHLMAGWQSGYAAACKAVYAGSIPTPASKLPVKPFQPNAATHSALVVAEQQTCMSTAK